jgi:hypothetical protein
MLSKKHLENYCLPQAGHKRCRYLAEDEENFGKCYCIKKTKHKIKIDAKLEALLKSYKAKNIDPAMQGRPLGDNCKGFIILEHKEQGYDV